MSEEHAQLDYEALNARTALDLSKAKQKIERLEGTLRKAREKLALYRAQHSGNYIGGLEYNALIRRIDEALDKEQT